jgi:hypothetical protein
MYLQSPRPSPRAGPHRRAVRSRPARPDGGRRLRAPQPAPDLAVVDPQITDRHARVVAEAHTQFAALAPLAGDRKAFALEAVRSEHKSLLFLLLDDQPIGDPVWASLEPTFERPFLAATETAE